MPKKISCEKFFCEEQEKQKKKIDALLVHFGEKIANERKRQEMNQELLAELTITSVDTIKRIERGQAVELKTLLAVIDNLGLKVTLCSDLSKETKKELIKELVDSL